MHILYVSQYFPPEMGAPAARVHELARHWAKAGHRVTVLTGFPNHPTGIVPMEYRHRHRRLTSRERVDGIDVVRTWLYPAPNRYPTERVLNYTSFFASACIRGALLPRPDVVVATSPQLLVGLCGWWLARIKRCPVVFEVRDLWPESLVASGVGRESSPLIRALRRLAAFLYRRCDQVVVVTEAFKTYLVSQGMAPARKIEVVENGVETEIFRPVPDRERLRAELGFSGRFVVAYIGTMGYAHGLDVVLEVARRIQDTLPDVLFVLVGEGADKGRLKGIAESARLRNVRFVDQQPHERIPVWINAADVCLVLLRKAELFTTVLPSKMLEFMACGRPVVLGVDGQARKVLEEAGAGLCIEPECPEALEDAVRRLYVDREFGTRLGHRGWQFVAGRYSRAQTAEKYLDVLTRVCSTWHSANGDVRAWPLGREAAPAHLHNPSASYHEPFRKPAPASGAQAGRLVRREQQRGGPA